MQQTRSRQPNPPGVGRRRHALLFALALMAASALYGCGTAPATVTPIQQIVPTETPAATAAGQPGTGAQATWVPPTALVGTPRPGAVATLTAAPRLKTGTLTIVNADGENVNIHVEIADTQSSREVGLMHRTTMGANEGMLFDFGGESSGGFWMQNTLLPLSIAFIAGDGTIVNIADMQPLDTNITPADGPYFYALEANQGFFRANNILAGGKVLLPVALDPAGGQAMIPGMPDCPDPAVPRY